MNGKFAMLVQREFWEHRSLWMAPLIAAGVLILLAVVGALFGNDGVHISGFPGKIPPAARTGAGPVLIAVYALSMQIFAVAAFTIAVYLLDCLHAERKDRSILFWKSLPVSDAQAVLAKCVAALVVVPAGAFLLALVTLPVMFGITALGLSQVRAVLSDFSLLQWAQSELALLASVAVSLLWYAPLAAWLLLASVVSRRAPLMWAVLPWVTVAVAVSIVWQSSLLWRFIGWRLTPIGEPLAGLVRPGLWLGLAAAAGMLYIVIRLRRFRDDT